MAASNPALTVEQCDLDEFEETVQRVCSRRDSEPELISRYPSGKEPLSEAVGETVQSLPEWCRTVLATQRETLRQLSPEESAVLRRHLVEQHAEQGWQSTVIGNAYHKDPDATIRRVSDILQQALWQDLDLAARPSPLDEIGTIAEAYITRCTTHGYLPPTRVIPQTLDVIQDSQPTGLDMGPLVISQGEEFVPMDEDLIKELATLTPVVVILTRNAAIRRQYTEPGNTDEIAASLREVAHD